MHVMSFGSLSLLLVNGEGPQNTGMHVSYYERSERRGGIMTRPLIVETPSINPTDLEWNSMFSWEGDVRHILPQTPSQKCMQHSNRFPFFVETLARVIVSHLIPPSFLQV